MLGDCPQGPPGGCPSDSVCAAQIHWFSIINSCVTVLLLTGFLATILMRVLKNDFIKYTRDDDGATRSQRVPKHGTLACRVGLVMRSVLDCGPCR